MKEELAHQKQKHCWIKVYENINYIPQMWSQDNL